MHACMQTVWVRYWFCLFTQVVVLNMGIWAPEEAVGTSVRTIPLTAMDSVFK